jgi:hypothetical protein
MRKQRKYRITGPVLPAKNNIGTLRARGFGERQVQNPGACRSYRRLEIPTTWNA